MEKQEKDNGIHSDKQFPIVMIRGVDISDGVAIEIDDDNPWIIKPVYTLGLLCGGLDD